MKQKDLTAHSHQDARTTAANGLVVCPQVFSASTAGQRLRTAILGLGLLVFAVTNVRSANWYVDPAASGTNKGTNWANAWTAFSSIVWGSSGVKAGDTLYLSGGSASRTYSSTLTIGASGASGNPIAIRVGQDVGHNGTAVFNGAGIVCQRSYITIDGSVGGTSHLMITNVANSGNKDGAVAIDGNGTQVAGIRIAYVTIVHCNNGLHFWAATAYEFDHNTFSHMLGDAVISVFSPGENGWNYNGTIHHNSIERTGQYPGPDGIQCGGSVAIYNNTFNCTGLNDPDMAPGQHPDSIQAVGNYTAIYNNEFINDGDSQIDYDCYGDTAPHDVRIYNNIFRYTAANPDTYPDAIRVYNSFGGGVTALVNWKIFNNTFVDIPNWDAVSFGHYFNWGSPTGTGNEIKNNLFVNCGSSGGNRALLVAQSSGFSASSWSLDGNIYYYPGSAGAYVQINGSARTASSWIAANEPHGKTNKPVFVSYTAFAANNDFHLASADTAARDAGVNLSSYFTTDKDGNPRGTTWSIGAYEYGGGGPSTNPVISVSPSSLNFGQTAVGTTNDLTVTVRNAGAGTLAGTASVSTPFSIVSGGTYSLGSNQTQTVTLRYRPTSAGSHSQTVSFTGGGGTSLAVSGSASTPLTGLSFESVAGIITGPFEANAGSVSQTVETGVTDGGRAVYTFTVTNTGSYFISANVDAPRDEANSFFVNIDAEPTDPTMIWDILPFTTGFESRVVSWRGNGAFDAPQYTNALFNLSAGTPHQLIIRGREANTLLGRITLLKVMPPPTNLRALP